MLAGGPALALRSSESSGHMLAPRPNVSHQTRPAFFCYLHSTHRSHTVCVAAPEHLPVLARSPHPDWAEVGESQPGCRRAPGCR